MQEKMQLLKDLQELDQELNTVRHSRAELTTEQAALNQDLERIQAMVDSLVAESETLQAQRRELTQALQQERENVEKAEGRLPGIKTQKEYVAVLKEIDTAKKLNKELDDQVRGKDEALEALNRDREEKEAELTSLKEKVDARKAEISAAVGEYDQTLESRNGEREELLKNMPRRIRRRYEMLLDRRGGIAIVEARNGTCLGCNMHLPPQFFNSLFQQEEIQTCPHCHRLLFVEAV